MNFKKITRLAVMAFLTTLTLTPLHAQKAKKVETTFEEVQAKCENRPREERVRLAVTRFNITANNADAELGENMSTMLTNTLQQVNCFRVLEMLKNADDLKGEIDFKNSGYANSNSTPEQGAMLGAQVVVTGEITEFTIRKKQVGIAGVSSNKDIVKMGFIVKLLNPVTRDILWSKSVNVEGKKSGGMSVGLGIPLIGRLNLGSGTNENPAIANALEQGVFKATELIVNNIDDIELPEVEDPDLNKTNMNIYGVDYLKLSELQKMVKGLSNVVSVKKQIVDSNGTLTISHKESTEDIMDQLMGKITAGFNVTGVERGLIFLDAK